MENCTLKWREAHLEVNMLNAQRVRSTFGSGDAEKVRREVHLKLNMLKPSHVPLSKVPMSKKCTPLCREARCESKCKKARHVRLKNTVGSTFGLQKRHRFQGSEHFDFWTLRVEMEKVHATVVARRYVRSTS